MSPARKPSHMACARRPPTPRDRDEEMRERDVRMIGADRERKGTMRVQIHYDQHACRAAGMQLLATAYMHTQHKSVEWSLTLQCVLAAPSRCIAPRCLHVWLLARFFMNSWYLPPSLCGSVLAARVFVAPWLRLPALHTQLHAPRCMSISFNYYKETITTYTNTLTYECTLLTHD